MFFHIRFQNKPKPGIGPIGRPSGKNLLGEVAMPLYIALSWDLLRPSEFSLHCKDMTSSNMHCAAVCKHSMCDLIPTKRCGGTVLPSTTAWQLKNAHLIKRGLMNISGTAISTSPLLWTFGKYNKSRTGVGNACDNALTTLFWFEKAELEIIEFCGICAYNDNIQLWSFPSHLPIQWLQLSCSNSHASRTWGTNRE